MIFYMSQEGRKISEVFSLRHKCTPEFRAFIDTMALRDPGHVAIAAIHRIMGKIFRPDRIPEILARKPIYKDVPLDFDFSDYLEGYRYLTEQFVVRDFNRTDLLSISHMVRSYDDRAIIRLGDRCKKLKKFKIPYLLATIESEGAEVIEGIRKENRLDDLVRETIYLELGTYRPTNILDHMEDLEEERRLETIGDS